MKVVFVTTSKFKNEIMDKVGIKHSMTESDFDEDSVNENDVYEYVKKLAFGKASSVKDNVSDSIIIGLDTINYVDGVIQEKPINLKEARKYIEMCKNNTTKVITGICIINQKTNKIISDYAETKITLRDIDNLDIDYYIENEPDIMYASGFILETILSNFIDKIEGSYYNILGVPVETIYRYINDMGYNLKDLEG